jgi:hypothetical protein
MKIAVADYLGVNSVVLCEDVRAELGGKWTILGVMAGDMNVPSLPTNIKIGLYIEATVRKEYNGFAYIRLRLDSEQLGMITGTVDVKSGYLSLPIAGHPVGVPRAGTFFVDISLDQDDWQTILSRKMQIAPSTSSISQPQLSAQS